MILQTPKTILTSFQIKTKINITQGKKEPIVQKHNEIQDIITDEN